MENQSKFLKSEDYDRIVLDLLNESENRLGLLCDIFKIQKGRNPDFICLMQNAIDRRKQPIYSKYIGVIKYNPTFQPAELNPLLSLEDGVLALEAIEYEEIKPQEDKTARQELNKKKGKATKGKSILSREQVVMLFFYLRENSLVAPNVENGTFASAIEAMTGHSATQIQNILKMPGNPISLLGKSDSRVSKKDLKDLIPEIEKLLSRMKKDLNTFE